MGYQIPRIARKQTILVDRGDGYGIETEALEFYLRETGQTVFIELPDQSAGVGRYKFFQNFFIIFVVRNKKEKIHTPKYSSDNVDNLNIWYCCF